MAVAGHAGFSKVHVAGAQRKSPATLIVCAGYFWFFILVVDVGDQGLKIQLELNDNSYWAKLKIKYLVFGH